MAESIPEKSSTWSRWDIVWCATLTLLMIGIHLPLLHQAIGLIDEGICLVYPELLSRGWVMHRDFRSGYGPGAFWLLQAVFAITGPSVTAERIIAITN